jgi:hypothetical protein
MTYLGVNYGEPHRRRDSADLVKDIGKRCMSDAGRTSSLVFRVAVDKVPKAASIDQGQVSERVIVARGISDGYGR